MRSTLILALCALPALAMPAAATVYTETLTGTIANGVSSTFINGLPGHKALVSNFFLHLDGFQPITVTQGDEVDFTVTLDQPFVVPQAVGVNFGQFLFFQVDANAFSQYSNTQCSLALSGVSGAPFGGLGCEILGVEYGSGNGPAYSFTGLTASFFVDTPVTFDSVGAILVAEAGLHDITPVSTPEPASMILFGLAVGAASLVAGNRRRG